MPSRARVAFQLDSLTRAPRSPPQSNPGTGAALLDRREADVSSEDEEHGGMERRGVRDDPAERAPRLSAHPERAAAAAAAGRAEHPREGLADRHDGGQDDEECSGLLEGMGAWIGGSALGADRRKLDSALLRSPGSMPGWGGDWGGGDGSKEHESLDFDTVNTPFWADSSRQQQKRGFMYGVGHAMIRSKRLYQWLFTVAIGVLVALSAKLIQVLIALLISVRNQRMQEYYDAGSSDNNIFVFFAGYNAVLVVSSGVLALCAGSSAAGDGVAEVKAYLNGSHIRGCFNLRAILCKIAGTTLASAAALACGPEGPMIHIGAGIAYAITCIDNLSSVLPALTPSILARFTNDRDRREFIAAGAGAGIAAAFGAPIGGVLFALEEAASHWSPQLIWRIFTSAMVATFTLALIRAGGHSGDISLAGLLSSGTKISLSESKGGVMINPDGSAIVSVMDAPVYVWELVLFLGLGAVGGMLGGVLNASYNLLAPMRPTSRTMRLVEVLFLSLATSYTLFFLAAFTPRCTPNGTWTCRDADNWGDHCAGPADNSTCVGMRAQCVNATGWMCVGGQNNGLACVGRGGFEDCEWRGGSCNALHQSHRFFGMRANCQEGEYHELATLFFGDKSSSIIRMVTQSAPHQDAPFSNQSLIIAAAAYQVLMMAPYGAHARTHTHAHTNTRARAHTHTRQE
jgi:H+/Cl- antiporter ClcA